ncbi:MAG: hypothetical protein A2284_08845 [Deltaproteobacteria bacterium RIFOXYA12_FULL_61_11]|nr:MAG: hypothetical protein A2284_08845 [Deltaproteobacteria bacterium RIFOXYA12_FULL_61_11]
MKTSRVCMLFLSFGLLSVFGFGSGGATSASCPFFGPDEEELAALEAIEWDESCWQDDATDAVFERSTEVLARDVDGNRHVVVITELTISDAYVNIGYGIKRWLPTCALLPLLESNEHLTLHQEALYIAPESGLHTLVTVQQITPIEVSVTETVGLGAEPSSPFWVPYEDLATLQPFAGPGVTQDLLTYYAAAMGYNFEEPETEFLLNDECYWQYEEASDLEACITTSYRQAMREEFLHKPEIFQVYEKVLLNENGTKSFAQITHLTSDEARVKFEGQDVVQATRWVGFEALTKLLP